MGTFQNRCIASSLLLSMSLLVVSCNLPASRHVLVWLDVPVNGLHFPTVQEIQIEGHASGAGGLSRVEVWVEGALVATIEAPAVQGDLARFHAVWTPSAVGTYTIQAVAYGRDGSPSAPDSTRVTFGGAPPTAPGCPSPVGGGPTPVTCPALPAVASVVPGADVQFWADPASITAGGCTDIRWHATNVKTVVFGGVAQPLDGSYEACLCDDERYTLVVTHLDGTEDRRSLDVPVDGTCVTEEPSDTSPPPVPQLAVPANGLTIACKSSQTLAWLPVNDPSKISEYRVQVQRHPGDANWQGASGSPFTGLSDKQVSVDVECGWFYRWRVRAVDGVGNEGDFSDWSEFSITLE